MRTIKIGEGKGVVINDTEKVVGKDSLIEDIESNIIKNDDGIVVQTRSGGAFAYKAIWLNPTYDWIIGRDSGGHPILIPIKKE